MQWVGFPVPDRQSPSFMARSQERVIEENPTEVRHMPKMKSLQRHEYGGRFYNPDEEFDCDPAHAQLLTTIGRAELVNQGEHNTRAMESSQAAPTIHRNNRHQRRTS